ncbi:MAG: hypothetical protein CVU84_12380 [Firmicutes bacterium HGW-Firmicutes-1]|jgi:hypothetical protein|nr:MAG: hypothetical protein CVU84_12380 [Firmicutes bacterium HGW-Firmicutes-1]
MKKYIPILIICLLLLGSTGCKKQPEAKTLIQQPNTVAEDVSNQGVESTTEGAPVTDVATEGTIVTNEGLLTELQGFVEKFYYNFLFKPQAENGKLTDTDMQLFAISFIYQFEYNELRFDSEKFVLYIPEANVTEVIKRFFDYDFTTHKYPENSPITYEDGYYLMKARDVNFGAKPVIKEALQLSEHSYKIVFGSSDANVKEKYEAIIEDRDGRWVVISYKIVKEAAK